MNLVKLGPTEVLHRRWVKLGNDRGELECLGVACLTVAAGDHPLFHGVRTAVVAGLPAEPGVRVAGGSVQLEASGLRLRFADARPRREGTEIHIDVE